MLYLTQPVSSDNRNVVPKSKQVDRPRVIYQNIVTTKSTRKSMMSTPIIKITMKQVT